MFRQQVNVLAISCRIISFVFYFFMCALTFQCWIHTWKVFNYFPHSFNQQITVFWSLFIFTYFYSSSICFTVKQYSSLMFNHISSFFFLYKRQGNSLHKLLALYGNEIQTRCQTQRKSDKKKGWRRHLVGMGRGSAHLHETVTWSDKRPPIKVSAAHTLPAPVIHSGEAGNHLFFEDSNHRGQRQVGG